jgi:hypothetical protein
LTLLSFLFFETVGAQARTTKIRPEINKLIDKLAKEDEVHFGYPIGFSGKPETGNKYYKLYLKLKAKATNEELVSLTEHSFKPIVIYSFSILHSRGYKDIKTIFIAHLNDTSFYWTASGCTGFIERVNWFMLRKLNPGQNDNKKYLKKEEYDNYCTMFKKQDYLFSCN